MLVSARRNLPIMSNSALDHTWLIIPLFNEEPVIFDVVSEALQIFPNIVCVDDGSSDNSAERAHNAGAWVISHPFNLGQGAAIQTGLDFATSKTDAKYFVTFDSDGQHSVADAVRMVSLLSEGEFDIVIGSRFIGAKALSMSWIKKLVLKLAVLFERIRTGLKLTDAHNGLRAMNLLAATKIQISQNRMAHASEITAQIAENRLRYAEIPVTIRYTSYSKSKGQSVWNTVNILSDLWTK